MMSKIEAIQEAYEKTLHKPQSKLIDLYTVTYELVSQGNFEEALENLHKPEFYQNITNHGVIDVLSKAIELKNNTFLGAVFDIPLFKQELLTQFKNNPHQLTYQLITMCSQDNLGALKVFEKHELLKNSLFLMYENKIFSTYSIPERMTNHLLQKEGISGFKKQAVSIAWLGIHIMQKLNNIETMQSYSQAVINEMGADRLKNIFKIILKKMCDEPSNEKMLRNLLVVKESHPDIETSFLLPSSNIKFNIKNHFKSFDFKKGYLPKLLPVYFLINSEKTKKLFMDVYPEQQNIINSIYEKHPILFFYRTKNKMNSSDFVENFERHFKNLQQTDIFSQGSAEDFAFSISMANQYLTQDIFKIIYSKNPNKWNEHEPIYQNHIKKNTHILQTTKVIKPEQANIAIENIILKNSNQNNNTKTSKVL